MNIYQYINTANAFLSGNYGLKHCQTITIEDIEKVYNRTTIISVNGDSKTIKGVKQGYLTGILYLFPGKAIMNVCPFASQGCLAACLVSAGRGRFYSVTRARIVKTLAYINDIDRFRLALDKSVAHLIRKAIRDNLTPVIRLNGTSDLLIERVYSQLLLKYSNIQWYDYTKNYTRFKKPLPANYHLTFSLSETNELHAREVLELGHNVAVVFRKELPIEYMGYPVINGDESDLRFLDGNNVVVGLTAKGKAKIDDTGFVKDIA